MRLSEHMPSRTRLMLAPYASHRLAISLMKEIFVARNAFAAYFVSYAVTTLVSTIGVSIRKRGR